MKSVATIVYVLGILALFRLDKDRRAKTSLALWLPIFWLLIAGSRPVSAWLNAGPAMSADQYLEGSPIDRAMSSSLLLAGLFVLYRRRAHVARFFRANWPVVAFVLYCAVSVAWSDYPDVALKRWIKSLGDYAMVLIVLTDPDRPIAIRKVLARVAFILFPLSILFIKYYPDLGRTYATHWEGTQFFVGVAQDKNMLGMTCLVFGLAGAWRVFQELDSARRIKILVVHGAVTGMALWLLWMCNSMTSLACFLLASSVMAALTFFSVARRRLVMHLLIVSALVSCFSVLFLDVGGFLLKAVGRNPTLTGRTGIWEKLLKVPINSVFGTGFESFWLGKRLEYVWTNIQHINEAHNGYLEVYLNLGIIGLMLIIAIMVSGYRNVVRQITHDPEGGSLRVAYYVIGVTYNFTEAAIRTTDLVWVAFLLTVIALPQRAATGRSVANDHRSGPRRDKVPAIELDHEEFAPSRVEYQS